MDLREPLTKYPYVTVNVACRYCGRSGRYRLARLAERFGAGTSLSDVLRAIAWDCPHWKKKGRWVEGCGIHYPDLEASPPKPPNEPPSMRVLTVIRGGRNGA